MDVNISKKTEQRILEIAKQNGQEGADVAGALLEGAVERIPSSVHGRRKTLADLTGIFYGGPGDTAAKATEILRAELGESSLGRD
jgi:hypothetical protein